MLLGTAKVHELMETKVLTGTELELKTLLLQKKREGWHLRRAELNRLSRAIWREQRALKREKHLTKIQESAEAGERLHTQKTESKHFNWSSVAKQQNPETVLTSFFQDLCAIPADQLDLAPSREDSLDTIVEEVESGLCRWNIDFNEEVEESPEQGEIREKINGPDHSRRLEGIAFGLSGKTGKIAARDVLGHELPGGVDVLFDGNGTKGCVCNEPNQVQGDRCFCVRCEKSWATFGLSSLLHCCTKVCRRRLCRRRTQMFVCSVAEGGRAVSITAERNGGGAAGREESVRPCGPSSVLQGNEAARCESVLDGF